MGLPAFETNAAWLRWLDRLDGVLTGNVPQWTYGSRHLALAPGVVVRDERDWLGQVMAYCCRRDRYWFLNADASPLLSRLEREPLTVAECQRLCRLPGSDAASLARFLGCCVGERILVTGTKRQCEELLHDRPPPEGRPPGLRTPAGPLPGSPLFVTVFLTLGCNLSCSFCNVTAGGAPADSLRGDDWSRIARELAANRVLAVTIDGGEPLIHPEFPGILEAFARQPFTVRLVTNGIHMPPALPAIVDKADNVKVMVGLDGPDAAVHDRSRDAPGAFDAAVRTIRSLVEVCPQRVTVATLIHRGNVDRLEETAAFVAGLGIPTLHFLATAPAGRARTSPLYLNLGDHPELIRRLGLIGERHLGEMTVTVQGRGGGLKTGRQCGPWHADPVLCNAGVIHMCLGPAGEVYPCDVAMMADPSRRTGLRLGSVLNDGLGAAWRADAWRPYRGGTRLVDLGGCRRCSRFHSCSVSKCRLYALATTGDLRGSPPECRPD